MRRDQSIWRALPFWLAVGLAITVAGVAFVKKAFAHGPAEWIARGAYKNAAGDLCCGERDCGIYVGGTIEHEPGGYRVNADFRIEPPNVEPFIVRVKEFVPEADATPSPTGDYFRCQWGGVRKCFFAPLPAT